MIMVKLVYRQQKPADHVTLIRHYGINASIYNFIQWISKIFSFFSSVHKIGQEEIMFIYVLIITNESAHESQARNLHTSLPSKTEANITTDDFINPSRARQFSAYMIATSVRMAWCRDFKAL